MAKYLLSIYQPDSDEPPPAEFLEPIARKVEAFHEEAQASGKWVFGGGLHLIGASTVVHAKPDGKVHITDGPYLEGKEHVGGFVVMECEDLDEALEWGRKQSEATTLPTEVRDRKSVV